MPRVPENPGSSWLAVGGWLSFAASALHIGCIIGGGEWYRFFGAGEGMASAAERGEWMPAIVTFGIAAVLALWGAYAFSGAGRLRRLPLLRTGLVMISAIYLTRGLVIVPVYLLRPELIDSFALWSSLVVCVYGAAYAVGTARAWSNLAPGAEGSWATR